MKSNFLFFAGLFSALLISWLGVVIGSNAQLGSLAPYYDENDGSTHPEWLAGVAAQGQLEYKSLGCVACHTQQVRRPSFGSDQARGWGDRQSVARDYIYQPFPQLGLSRVGPDLTNVGDRKTPYDSADLLTLLYAGAHGMPSYRFLFETRRLGVDAQPSENALKLTGALKPAAGWEIVPTRRAESLVGYLVNLKTTYTYPEAVPFVAKVEGEGAKPAPAAAPAAAPAGVATPATAGPTPAPGITSAPAAAQAAAATPAPASPTPLAAQPVPSTPETAAPANATAATPAPSVAAPAANDSAPSPTPAASQSAALVTPPVPSAPAPATTPPAGSEPTPSPTGGTK
jgi:cytochrome c oxidase cbb3-type subunit II